MKKKCTNIVVNLGCRLNDYESSAISDILEKENHENTIVVNTCAVTKEAEKKSVKEVRKLQRDNPDKKIIVTGCAAQLNPQKFAKIPKIAKVIGNGYKLKSSSYADILNNSNNPESVVDEKILVNDIMSVTETASHLLTDRQHRSRAFVQIQNGCNHRCTFCIIPYARGNSRSVPMPEIINQIDILVDNGYNEVVLTGVDITDYGSTLPGNPKLGNLCKRILSHTGLKRLRLSSVDVAEIDEDLLDLIANEPRFMPYFHISLQAGDDLILKRMKRRHCREDVIKFCENIRKLRKDVGFGADIICGFPTETDEMFKNTIDLIKETGIQYIHAFSYSEREGTPASKMPQVDVNIRKSRTNELIQVGNDNLNIFLKTLVNTTQIAVVEKDMNGKAENFVNIKFTNEDEVRSKVKPGELVKCKAIGVEDDKLLAVAEL